MMWYGLDGTPIDIAAAEALLRDDLARRVAHTAITTEKGRVEVSTVFLVIDHNHWGGGPPVLWETMVFGGPSDMDQRRYTSLPEAEAGHAETLAVVLAELDVEGTAVLAVESFDRTCRSS